MKKSRRFGLVKDFVFVVIIVPFWALKEMVKEHYGNNEEK